MAIASVPTPAESFLEDYDPAQIGVLIADVRMPGMSGLELQEQLIARNAPLPIVFITGHGDVPMAVSTMKKGAVDFLEKPFNESDLREIVARMLGAHRRRPLEQADRRRPGHQHQDVEAHRANIMEKLEVTTVADLMKVALAKPRRMHDSKNH